jgi:formylglycine-generating enzyme required for sulfatase activity
LGKGKFQAVISGLTGATTYYIRAYAISGQGVTYGNAIEVKTLPSTDGAFGKFVKVNGGTFNRGSDFGNNIEKPIHPVTLKSFFIGETEVTQSVWEEIMGVDPSFNYNCDNCPVENVSWLDIQEFLKKINEKQSTVIYRLPTEAEWEYAARGGANGSDFLFAGSSGINAVGWYRENSNRKSQPVKSKSPNALGLYDMSGNVWEWVQDWFNFYKADALTNPSGPLNGSSKLYRGGSFDDISDDCRVTYRYGNPPASRFNNLGFRLAHD